jgi:lipopolysaccharide/colanic/teichoic acid biosynthesis glycosyltransferase
MQDSYRISAFRDIDTDRCEADSSITLQANGLVRVNGNGADRLISKSACIDSPKSSATTADDIATDSEGRVTGVGYQCDEGTFASVSRLQRRYGYRFAKRTFDIAFSLLVFALFWWLYVIVAIAIKIDDPNGSVFFVQERMGKDEKPFRMYKFRSMYADAEERLAELRDLNEKDGPVFKIKDDPRITKVGRFIRKTSIDELPQFFNVLLGNMSIVGPRPALKRETDLYTSHQRERLLVKPGITCYWQTRMNRDEIGFDEWIDLDLLYINQCSAWTDFKLVIQTVGCVLTAQGS